MNVKNIKSFVEFYESLGISTFITKSQRSSNTRSNSIYLEKDNPIIINENSIVGAGSVITKNINKKSLALTRSPQLEVKNYKRKKK